MAYAGIDSDEFPGLAAMAALKTESNAVWCAYYLEAPSHSNGAWSGNRAALEAQGWGFAPVYVGQQIVGPGSHKTSPTQGSLDGADAVAKMKAEGFELGSVVFLDLENGEPFVTPQTNYVEAFCNGVEALGYGAGVYCSHDIAAAVAEAVPSAIIWAFDVPTLKRTTLTGDFPTPDPSGSGFPEAAIWQRADSVAISGPGYSMLVDLDVSVHSDPSALLTAPIAQPAPVAAPAQPAAPAPVIPFPVYAPTNQPTPAAAVIQHAPPIAAGATGLTALAGILTAGSTTVNFQAFVDKEWPLIVAGVILPLVVWGFGRLLQQLNISTNSAVASELRTIVMNGAYEATSAVQTYADAHPDVDLQNALVARVTRYAITAAPQLTAKVTSTQLANLVNASLAQLPAPTTS